MATTKKIDKTDLESINKLRDEYSQNSMQLGMVSVDEYNVNQQLQQIVSTKEELFSGLEKLKKQEFELIEKLKERYGDGQINIEQGTFTSIE
tara:strand:- start:95 stop:370 length:276 start_codon:yes stop_codon:yes gene_type:complete